MDADAGIYSSEEDREDDVSELTLDEVFTTAQEHQHEGNHEDAILCFGYALQKAEQQYGPNSVHSTQYYFHYGDALLTSEDSSADDLLGVSEAATGAAEQDAADVESLAVAGSTSPGGRERPQDDIELAWEMLELARICAEKFLAQNARRCVLLPEILSRLGDVHQANEQFEEALDKYRHALEVRKQIAQERAAGSVGAAGASGKTGEGHETWSEARALAAEHCNIARALQWSKAPQPAESARHYSFALHLLEELLTELPSPMPSPMPSQPPSAGALSSIERGQGRAWALNRAELVVSSTVRPSPDDHPPPHADTLFFCVFRFLKYTGSSSGGARLFLWRLFDKAMAKGLRCML
eukprot:SAG11_NODE_571_length_8451_cov_34.938218_4_plen_354_part_00